MREIDKELFRVISRNSIASICSIKELIELGADINICDKCNDTPLIYAITQNNYLIAELLIDKGADINACNQLNMSPIYVAAQCNNFEICKLLINNKADVNIVDKFGYTPLYWSIDNYCVDIVKLLLENGANPFVKDFTNKTLLDIAYEIKGNRKEKKVIIKLLNHYLSINYCERQLINNFLRK